MSENIKKRKIQKGGGIDWESLGTKLYNGTGAVIGSPVSGVMNMGKGAAAPFQLATQDLKDIAAAPIEELSPIDAVRRQIQDNKSSLQIANEKFKGENAFKDGDKGPRLPGERLYAEPAFWDLLYDEPCWINPETGSFELQVALEELWHKWYIAESVKDVIGEIMGGEGVDEDMVFDKKKAYEIFHEKYIKGNEKEKYGLNRGFDAVMLELEEGKIKMDTALQMLSIQGDDNRKKIMDTKQNIAEALATGGPEGLGENGTTTTDKDWSKWGFCFLFKFIMGPVGPLILKLMPYFFKFLFTIQDFCFKILNTLFSPYVFYLDKDKEVARHDIPTGINLVRIGHVVGTYFGTVIPINLFSHKWGEILGKGQFGKLIISMAVVSAGIILLGYISVFVFLLVFALYCGKAVSMFGDNIDEQKKK